MAQNLLPAVFHPAVQAELPAGRAEDRLRGPLPPGGLADALRREMGPLAVGTGAAELNRDRRQEFLILGIPAAGRAFSGAAQKAVRPLGHNGCKHHLPICKRLMVYTRRFLTYN